MDYYLRGVLRNACVNKRKNNYSEIPDLISLHPFKVLKDLIDKCPEAEQAVNILIAIDSVLSHSSNYSGDSNGDVAMTSGTEVLCSNGGNSNNPTSIAEVLGSNGGDSNDPISIAKVLRSNGGVPMNSFFIETKTAYSGDSNGDVAMTSGTEVLCSNGGDSNNPTSIAEVLVSNVGDSNDPISIAEVLGSNSKKITTERNEKKCGKIYYHCFYCHGASGINGTKDNTRKHMQNCRSKPHNADVNRDINLSRIDKNGFLKLENNV